MAGVLFGYSVDATHTPRSHLRSLFEKQSVCSCSTRNSCCAVIDPTNGCEVQPTCENGQCIVPLTPHSVNALNALSSRKITIDWTQVERENKIQETNEVDGQSIVSKPLNEVGNTIPLPAGFVPGTPLPDWWYDKYSPFAKQQRIKNNSGNNDNAVANSADEDELQDESFASIDTIAGHSNLKCTCDKVIKCTPGDNAPCTRRNPYAWCKSVTVKVLDGTTQIGVCVISVQDWVHHRTVDCRCP